MKLDQIEALAEVLERVPRLAEIEVRSEGASLRLRRGGAVAPAPPTAPAAEPVAPEPSPAEPVRVRSGVVGVFHRVEPALDIGDRVREGDVLGQIETMRIDNDCKAPVSGRILAVYVLDAQPVEYGQLLFDIEAEA